MSLSSICGAGNNAAVQPPRGRADLSTIGSTCPGIGARSHAGPGTVSVNPEWIDDYEKGPEGAPRCAFEYTRIAVTTDRQ